MLFFFIGCKLNERLNYRYTFLLDLKLSLALPWVVFSGIATPLRMWCELLCLCYFSWSLLCSQSYRFWNCLQKMGFNIENRKEETVFDISIIPLWGRIKAVCFSSPRSPCVLGRCKQMTRLKQNFLPPLILMCSIRSLKKKKYDHSVWLRNSPQNLVFFISLGVIAKAMDWFCGIYEYFNGKLGEYMYAVLECLQSWTCISLSSKIF